MKKTLALLLALLMLVSVALVSCADKPDETDPADNTDDPFAGVQGTEPNDSTGGDESNPDGTEPDDSSEFVAASGTYYLRHTVYVSKDGKKKGTETKNAGVANFGQEVTVTAENSKWYRITFDGKEGYVHKELLTKEQKEVKVIALETPVKAKISGLGLKEDGKTPYTINIRTTPWNCSDNAVYPNANVLINISNKKYSVSDGFEVEKIGATEDGKWIQIKYTVTIDEEEVVEYGFCSAQYITVDGEEVPDTPVTPDGPPAITPA